MKQDELINAVSTASGASKSLTEDVIKALGLEVRNQLNKGGEVTLPGIGKLSVTQRAARTGRNPQTGKEITIAARKAPKFSAAKALKDAVN